MNNVRLTTMERLILLCWPLNYSNSKDEIEDNATYTDIVYLSKDSHLPLSSVKGCLGSLVKKGLVEIDAPRNGDTQCLVLSDAGIEAAYILKTE